MNIHVYSPEEYNLKKVCNFNLYLIFLMQSVNNYWCKLNIFNISTIFILKCYYIYSKSILIYSNVVMTIKFYK